MTRADLVKALHNWTTTGIGAALVVIGILAQAAPNAITACFANPSIDKDLCAFLNEHQVTVSLIITLAGTVCTILGKGPLSAPAKPSSSDTPPPKGTT